MKNEMTILDVNLLNTYIYNAYQHNKDEYDKLLNENDERIYITFCNSSFLKSSIVETWREKYFLPSLYEDVRKDVKKNMNHINSGGKYIRERDIINPLCMIMLLSEAKRTYELMKNY
jgi:hypothetical protein